MSEFNFSINNPISAEGVSYALQSIFKNETPIIICVGTDATIGDSLGPIVGAKLIEKGLSGFVYGTLQSPITAKEIETIKSFVKNTHPYSKVLTIDAAVGKQEDIGVIKINNDGIKPGLGANKNLPKLGDASIIGIVAERSVGNRELLNFTRLGLIYSFAGIIAEGIFNFFQSN